MLMERRAIRFRLPAPFITTSLARRNLLLTIYTYDKFEVKWRPKSGAINSSQVAKG
jgi:hypothetical protein